MEPKSLAQKRCECGCGEPAPIASRSRRGKYRKGEPMRYINGHQRRGKSGRRGIRVVAKEVECARCGDVFQLRPGDIESATRRGRTPQQYCSLACKNAAGRAETTCDGCGQKFEHWRSVSRKYCSHACAGVAAEKVRVSCAVCSCEYEVIPSRESKTKCCSFDCLIRYNAECNKLKGREARNRTARPAWRARRREILDRDGHECRRCGAAEGLTVHHIVPWRKSRDDSHKNLVTLCRPCHATVEPRPAFNKRRSA